MPLSYGQRSLWFLHHLAPAESAYNIAATARLAAEVEAGALERAFQALVDRHAALRATFPEADGEPMQRVAGALDLRLVQEDVTGWGEARLRSRLAAEAWSPFDLGRGPLLRVTLWTGDPDGPVLLLVVHHIVADFWSLAILMRELPALYREAAGGEPARLPPAGLAYEEHCRREREIVEGRRGEELLAFWRRALNGLPTLELAPDRPRPAVQSYRGDVRRLRLPGELSASLRARSRAQHATLFMALVAAFQALLCRYSGQDDLALGTPRAGRSQSSFAGTVGYFVQQVVLRGDLRGDPTFAELLERTKARVRAAFEHGEYPLSLLAEHLHPERDASRTPLFQVSFVLQKETRGAEGLTAFALGEEGVQVGPEDFRLESLSLSRMPAPFDLVLHAVERQGGLSLALQFNTDLFDGATAERLLEHWHNVLEGAAADPGTRIADLPLLSPAERRQAVVGWNETRSLYPREATIHELYEAQVEARPEAPAIVGEGTVWTYRELNLQANRLAHHLRTLGVEPEAPVGVCLDRSPELVAAVLGILKAGGVYVPLDPSYPEERLWFLLADSGVRLLVSRQPLFAKVPGGEVPAIALDRDAGALAQRSEENPAPAGSAGHLAYAMYTSGSTGRPKGVEVPHRAVVRLVRETDYVQLAPGDRVAHLSNTSFDAATFEIWGALLNGAALAIVPRDVALAPADLAARLRRERVTALFLTTALFNQVIREAPDAFAAVRHLLFGGEAADPDCVARALAQEGPERLLHVYGPTECTTFTCWRRLTAASQTGTSVPIGRPLANGRVYLLDRSLHPVPVGVPGELYAGGDGLARGYLRRPELTAERFVPDPFAAEAAEPGGRLYRTGDLARRRLDGDVEFLGRIDRQVKIRGFRVEPGEVEAPLARHPQVRDAVVVAWPPAGAVATVGEGAPGDRRLVAYVVAMEPRPGAAELRDALRRTLPEHMIPSAFVFLEELPVTPNGKLDRRALPAPRWSGAGSAAPQTPVERRLAAIWSDVLGLPRVGREDNFFELGGHSLLASRVSTRASQAFGVSLPLALLFESPRLTDLAARIEALADGAGGDPAPSVPRVPRPEGGRYPLSFSQERLWFLHRLAPASSMLNVAAAFGLRGELHVAALAASFTKVCARQEALRTRFGETEGAPWQEVLAPLPVTIPVIDLEGLAASASELQRLADGEAARAFDLSAGLPWRALLLRRSAGEHVLVLAIHHLATDGWSQEVFLGELEEVYAALLRERPPRLRELPVQYADYAIWQRRLVSGGTLERDLSYWRRQLAAAKAAPVLPGQRQRAGTAPRFRGTVHRFELAGETLEGLRKLAGAEAASVFMALFAAFVSLLHQYTGEEDLLIGTNVANRSLAQVEGLIGCFANTIALRADLSRNPTFRELLLRVRQVILAAFAHQEIPFERVLAEIQPRRDESHRSLIQVMFVMPNRGHGALELCGVEVERYELTHHTATTDLMVLVVEGADRLPGAFVYDRELFDGEAIARMARHFQAIVASAVEAPDRPVSCLDLQGPSPLASFADPFAGAI